MGKNIPKERKEGMYKAILELKSLEECFDFFEDICAMTELRSMEQRFEVASMLKKEKINKVKDMTLVNYQLQVQMQSKQL